MRTALWASRRIGPIGHPFQGIRPLGLKDSAAAPRGEAVAPAHLVLVLLVLLVLLVPPLMMAAPFFIPAANGSA